MKKKFEENESYKHRFAKELLASWFVDQNNKYDYCQVAQFKWRSNYGAFVELKFYETSDPYYFENSIGLKNNTDVNESDLRATNPLSWFDLSIDRGKILFVPDITIFHKGVAVILLEIVHKNTVTADKIKKIKKFFDGYHVEVYEIEAEEILKHTVIPKKLKTKLIIP